MRKLVESKIFSAYADILTMSAIVGYNNKQYLPIDKAASDGVLMQFFTEEDKDLMDMLAYSHSGKQSVLRDDEKYEIFENYANGGFPIMLNKLEIDNSEEVIDRKRVLTQYFALLVMNDFKLVDLEIESELLK